MPCLGGCQTSQERLPMMLGQQMSEEGPRLPGGITQRPKGPVWAGGDEPLRGLLGSNDGHKVEMH